MYHFQESNIIFHVLGLKCQLCGSYNTCRAAEPDSGAGGDSDENNTPEVVTPEEQDKNSSNNNEWALTCKGFYYYFKV